MSDCFPKAETCILAPTLGSLYLFLGSKELTDAFPSIVGFPASLFLFYAAIQKATVETEEDDKKFLSQNK